MKSLLNKLLHPNIALYILICIVGYTSVIITLTLKYDNTVFGYISYILSFYALILTILKVPTLYKIIYKKLDNMKYTNKFLHEEDFRNDIGLLFGVLFNLAYIIYKFTIGILMHSVWFGATAIYYLCLTGIRYYLLKNAKKKTTFGIKLHIYRFIGLLILVLTICIGAMDIALVYGQEVATYPGHIIYVVALYTFYMFVVAIINFIRYKKLHNPIYSAVKMLALITALMSMFTLQASMINKFGNNEEVFKLVMNSVTGGVIFILILGIAIYMIIKGTKEIKKLKEE